MKKFKITLTLIVILGIQTNIGCSKKDEYQPKGDYQAAGNYVTTGNNNNTVLNFDVTVYSWDWSYDNLYDRHYAQYQLWVNGNSAILCYVMSGSGKQGMPYFTSNSTNAWSEQYDFATVLFNNPPYIEFQYTNYISRTTAPSSDEYFYIVVVPPSARNSNLDLDWSDYEKVRERFNLDEPIKINSHQLIAKKIVIE